MISGPSILGSGCVAGIWGTRQPLSQATEGWRRPHAAERVIGHRSWLGLVFGGPFNGCSPTRAIRVRTASFLAAGCSCLYRRARYTKIITPQARPATTTPENTRPLTDAPKEGSTATAAKIKADALDYLVPGGRQVDFCRGQMGVAKDPLYVSQSELVIPGHSGRRTVPKAMQGRGRAGCGGRS